MNSNLAILLIFLAPGPPYIESDRPYSDLIDIDFHPPCEPNGIVTGYQVICKERNSAKNCGDRSFGRNQRRIRLDKLRRLTGYIVTLHAKTRLGKGKPATIEFYTKGDPSKNPLDNLILFYD